MNNKEAGLIMKNLFNKHLVNHKPSEPAAANYELASRNIDRATNCYSLEMEAAPAVEPQKCPDCVGSGKIATGSPQVPWRYCTTCRAVEKDRAWLLKHAEGEAQTMGKLPEAGSTRPEMPPTEEIIKEKLWDLCTQWEQKKNIEFTSIEGKKLFVQAVHDKLAASVQQEPLSAKSIANGIDWILHDKACSMRRKVRPDCDCNLLEIVKRTLQSQPAAPRTQGREQTFEQFWASTNNSNYFSERTITPERLKQIAKESWNVSLAQARTQPAPKSDDLRNVVVDILSNCANKYCHPGGYSRPQQTVINEQIDNAVKILQKFFTALPEAPSPVRERRKG